MTKQAGFKRRVRARTAKTGESYATGKLAGQGWWSRISGGRALRSG